MQLKLEETPQTTPGLSNPYATLVYKGKTFTVPYQPEMVTGADLHYAAEAVGPTGETLTLRWEVIPGWYEKWQAENADEDEACNWEEFMIEED